MMEQEIKLKDCFATFDDSDSTRGCADCGNSTQCQSFTTKFAEQKTATAEQAVDHYIATSKQETQLKMGRLIAYGITILILVLVFWEASRAV